LRDRIRSEGHPPAATAIKFLNFYYRYGFTLNNFFQYCRCIGWDIAITPDGPILLEGNTRWAVTSLQAPMKQGLFHGELKKVYQELAGDRPRLAF
jgi:hypothetical protein